MRTIELWLNVPLDKDDTVTVEGHTPLGEHNDLEQKEKSLLCLWSEGT